MCRQEIFYDWAHVWKCKLMPSINIRASKNPTHWILHWMNRELSTGTVFHCLAAVVDSKFSFEGVVPNRSNPKLSYGFWRRTLNSYVYLESRSRIFIWLWKQTQVRRGDCPEKHVCGSALGCGDLVRWLLGHIWWMADLKWLCFSHLCWMRSGRNLQSICLEP